MATKTQKKPSYAARLRKIEKLSMKQGDLEDYLEIRQRMNDDPVVAAKTEVKLGEVTEELNSLVRDTLGDFLDDMALALEGSEFDLDEILWDIGRRT